ncbi:hypothetical protein [Lysinibacillus sp. NPDC096259]|uniref:hypothetical protein n=1 Tax=Lysinibacillus sp. NPDC096259 TaxID=3390583 RepID=UPI003D092887
MESIFKVNYLSNRAVSEMVNGKQKSYPKASLNELINAFEITDMNELFKIIEVENNEETDN